MQSSNIIAFPSTDPKAAIPQFDYEAYERRAVSRYRRAAICSALISAVEALVTAAIGVCMILYTLVFLTIL